VRSTRPASQWALLRPWETLAEPQGDIDVLVDPQRVAIVRDVVVAEGFVVVAVAGPAADVHAVDFDPGERRFLWIHVQTELRVAGASLPAQPLLAGRSLDPVSRRWPTTCFSGRSCCEPCWTRARCLSATGSTSPVLPRRRQLARRS
jgi:hypothetical protein